MRILMIVLALILISCKKENETKPAGKAVDSVKETAKDATPKFDTAMEYKSCQSSQFAFSFKKDSVSNVRLLIIRDLKTDSVVQEILLDESFHSERVDEDSSLLFNLEDVDFDGLTDFKILTDICPRGSSAYLVYRFDNKKQQFYKDSILSELTNLSVDTLNKRITSWDKGLDFNGNQYHYESHYHYQNHKLVQVGGEYIVWSEDSLCTTTKYHMKNGEQVPYHEETAAFPSKDSSVQIKEYKLSGSKRTLLKSYWKSKKEYFGE